MLYSNLEITGVDIMLEEQELKTNIQTGFSPICHPGLMGLLSNRRKVQFQFKGGPFRGLALLWVPMLPSSFLPLGSKTISGRGEERKAQLGGS